MKKLIISVTLASVSSLAFASTRVQLPVQQPIVAPHASSNVSLEALKKAVVYNIICIVKSNRDDTNITVKSEGSYHKPLLFANGELYEFQFQLPEGVNILGASQYWIDKSTNTGTPALIINNTDNDGTLVIKRCFADVSRSHTVGEPGLSELPGANE